MRNQSVGEALAVWERAFKEDRPVGLDERGNLTLIYGSTLNTFQNSASHKAAAKEAVVLKMRTEVSQGGSWDASVLLQKMETQLPSLARFLSSDEIGNLPEEWRVFKDRTANSVNASAEVLAKRKSVADAMTPFLPPGLGVSFHDNGLSWLSHTFSDAEQQAIINRLSTLSDSTVDPESHLAAATLRDISRGKYDIDVPIHQLEATAAACDNDMLKAVVGYTSLSESAKQTIRRLYAFCNGDLPMISTLSKLLNQEAISAVVTADTRELRPASGHQALFHSSRKIDSTLPAFMLRRTADGRILMSIAFFKKGSQLMDPEGKLLCRFKPGPNAEISTETHFNFRCRVDIWLSEAELRRGEISPQLARAATADYVLDIHW